MKKNNLLFLAFLLLAAWSGNASAQQMVLSKGLESKQVDDDDLRSGLYLGNREGLDCWIFEGKKHLKQVVLTDQNMMPLHVVELTGSHDATVLAAALDGDHVAVLTLDRGNRQTAVLSYVVDLGSMALTGTVADTVAHFAYSRKDRCMVWGASSPNGRYLALVGIVELTAQKQYTSLVVLFDSGMERLWEREFALGSVQDMMVTDDGRIVTLGIEDESDETRFVFNLMSQYASDHYATGFRCDPVREAHLARLAANHVLVVGTTGPARRSHAERYTNGIFALSFNLDSPSIADFTMRPFQNEDVNILLNKHTKRMQRDMEVEHASVLAWSPTAYGAVMAVGRTDRKEADYGDGSEFETVATGIHCVAVDTLGHLLWVRNIRRNDVQKGDGEGLRIALFEWGGMACIAKSEHAGYPAQYDIAKEGKSFRVGDKGNLVLYSVSPEGEVGKLLVEAKSKHALLRAAVRPDGVLALFSVRGSKTRQVQLKQAN